MASIQELSVAKAEVLVLRISTEDKATIKAASERLGKSLTTFITEAASKRAREIQKRPPGRGVHSGVPSFFKACCFEAARGGTGGYDVPGWHLTAALGGQAPYDLDEDEWHDELEKLEQLLSGDDDNAVFAWFEQHYPRCMVLIPARRREQFVVGVRRAHEDGRLDS
jgi:hypothetical protein